MNQEVATVETNSSGLKGLLRRGPIIVMLVIALFQITLASFGTLSPWKGGGFGMFSSLDEPGRRTVRYVARKATGDEFLVDAPVDSGVSAPEAAVRVHPTPGGLRRLGEVLKAMRRPAGFTELRIDLSRTKVQGARAEWERWISYTHPLHQ